MKSIAIIDYGAGNLRSIQKALEHIGFEAQITAETETVSASDGIILPGVGAFPTAMEKLKSMNMDKAIIEAANSNKPILGICLGMQLLFEKGYEIRECEGLGLLKGSIKKIQGDLKIPHMGWNSLNKDNNCRLLKDIEEGCYVYFVHSFLAELEDDSNLNASTIYGSKIPAVVSKGNIFGMQFHPEKKWRNWIGYAEELWGVDIVIILPAIDIRDGKCVRLYQGKFEKSEIVAESPLDTAKGFEKQGAQYIHMVDLDGALEGYVVNESIILEVLRNINIPVELGGGIRDIKTVEKLIEGGLSRVILGSAALKKPDFVKEAVKEFKEKIAVGIDAKNGFVSIEGWLNTSDIFYLDFAKAMEDIGVDNIIFTDISRDGTLKGPNLEQLLAIKEAVGCKITASGGIKDIDDIKKLKQMDVYGAITGKAIYSGELSLEEALREVK